ncbi:hypothetical protein BD309DRAFT_296397 [Dichomitus squalens]|nr:hypothetical protein BD309DRAFT_296397 [Dichomitus squalens]
MSYNEDTQPNEVRHSRKGNSAVPTVRSSQSFTGLRGRGRGHAQGRGSHHSRGGHGSPYVHPSPRGRDWSLRPASRAERPLGRTHDGLAPKRIPRWGENRGSVPVPERPPKRPRSEYSDCPDTKSDPSLTPLLVEPSADAGPSQCERLGKMSLVEIPEVRRSPIDLKSTLLTATNPCQSHGEPPDPSHSNHGRRLHPSDAIHPSLTITPSGPQVSSHTISPSSSRRSLGHHGHTMHRSESNVLLYGSRSALRTPTFPMDLTLKEEHPLSGVLQTITASSLPIRTPTGSLPSETTIQPAPAPIPPVEIPPASSHGGVTEVVPPALTHAPRFRSGTLRIELPPHVRPLDPRHFLCGQPQVQQDADTPQDRAANASLTHKGDSRPQQSVLMQPTPSVHANRPRVEDETKVPEVSAAPTDPTSGYFQRVEQVQMRREPHDKPRRLLALPSGAMLSVTTRGSLDLVAQDPLRCTALRTSAFGDSARQLIEDACILLGTHKPAIIVGRTGNSQQLSLVRIKEAKVRCPLIPPLRSHAG